MTFAAQKCWLFRSMTKVTWCGENAENVLAITFGLQNFSTLAVGAIGLEDSHEHSQRCRVLFASDPTTGMD